MRGINDSSIRARLERSGATYRGSYSGRFGLQCGGTPANSRATFELEVAAARVLRGDWRAVRLTGTLSHSEAAQLGCRASEATFALRGRLVN
ncbi:MAG: hypothetical protein ACRDNI_10880 [Gaiellaceae bacterium]